ncbi:hypothetical protein B0G57_1454 [Trinickia symbiotica]|uniref:MFS transporter n=1 Tax=Trinickia symbiotica TaxID=863227 RepID=A0A2N7X655_9BURK|nr:hypothetical protein [Trinickia symbiotica]PMS36955.1 hypothetical protein C0Z20_09470 [Trinickia symbiotica]PPK41034.1 hypothetical protein B0G57_1454 [Trinickia symbiotica]
MWNVARGIPLYWHLALDTTIAHFFTIYLAHGGHFALAAAVSTGDSLLKLVFAVPGSAVAARAGLPTRVAWCRYLRPALAVAWLAAISLLHSEGSGLLVIAALIAFKLLLLVDGAFSADFPFIAQQAFALDLSQSASIQNIISRGSLALAPAFALSIVNRDLDIFYFVPVIVVLLSLSLLALQSVDETVLASGSAEKSESDDARCKRPFSSVMANRLMRWGLLYQLVVNFAFGGVTYLLIVELKPTSNIALNGISALYFLFFVYQIAVMLMGDGAIPAARLSGIVRIVALTAGLAIAIGSCTNFWLDITLCSAMGLLYAFELGAVQKVLISKLKGPQYLSYSALSKVCARLASAASVAMLGFGVAMGISPSSLLIMCGVAGLFGALLLKLCVPQSSGRVARAQMSNEGGA